MKEYILIAALIGQPPAQLGTYSTYNSCQNAIRQIFMGKVYKDFRDNPEIKRAVDIQMKYQLDYLCIKRS